MSAFKARDYQVSAPICRSTKPAAPPEPLKIEYIVIEVPHYIENIIGVPFLPPLECQLLNVSCNTIYDGGLFLAPTHQYACVHDVGFGNEPVTRDDIGFVQSYGVVPSLCEVFALDTNDEDLEVCEHDDNILVADPFSEEVRRRSSDFIDLDLYEQAYTNGLLDSEGSDESFLTLLRRGKLNDFESAIGHDFSSQVQVDMCIDVGDTEAYNISPCGAKQPENRFDNEQENSDASAEITVDACVVCDCARGFPVVFKPMTFVCVVCARSLSMTLMPMTFLLTSVWGIIGFLCQATRNSMTLAPWVLWFELAGMCLQWAVASAGQLAMLFTICGGMLRSSIDFNSFPILR